MLQSEYIRNLNSNYERILLDEKPEEDRYQYCILNRGGIRGLLPCSLRYINGSAYLYYDITSKQTMAQLFLNKSITRDWVKDFMWSMQQLRQELNRFLLDDHNVLWNPEQIYQDLETNVFSFLYIPYYEGGRNFDRLLEFWVEHIDYDDEVLVDCVYHMYEQLDRNGEVYLQTQIFQDVKVLDQPVLPKAQKTDTPQEQPETVSVEDEIRNDSDRELVENREKREERKGFKGLFDSKRRKNRELRESYRQDMHRAMDGFAVAEKTSYDDEEYGRTVYIEDKGEPAEKVHRLYSAEDKLLASIEKPVLSLGKKKEEVDVVLEDASVSRIHARIIQEGADYYLEDLNSTNGTYKNGLRLQPYEKRKLDTGDELKCGRVVLIFR